MLNTQSLYDDVANEFGVFGGSKSFVQSFYRALKRIKADIYSRVFLEFDVPASFEENIDLDEQYYAVVYSGLVNYMNKGMEWNVVPKGDVEFDYREALASAQYMYLEDNPPDVYFESE